MTVSPSIPATVQMRRSRLLGLLAVVAIAATAITWAAVAATESGSGSAHRPGTTGLQLTPSEKQYVQGIASLSRVQQAAAFGGHGEVIDALGLDARDAAYVKAIVSLTPAQIAAGFGMSSSRLVNQLTPSEKQYVQGIASLSRVQQAAAFGGHGGVIDALGLDARDAAYVKAIVSLTPEEMAAGFGTSR